MQQYSSLMRPRARRPWLIWAAALSLLLLAAWGWRQVQHQVTQVRLSEAALQVAVAQRKLPPAPKPSRAELDQQRRWDTLQTERSYSWYPLFRALEQASSPDIELLEFVPDKTSGRVVLRGEARNIDGLTRYLVLLSAQDGLREVYLAHQKNISRAGMTLTAFEIHATTHRKGN